MEVLEDSMKEKDKIAHIVSRDKFTSGYINFMKLKFPQYEHSFFIRDTGFPLHLVDMEHVVLYHPVPVRFFQSAEAHVEHGKEILKMLAEAKMIVISGFWVQQEVLRWPQALWDKTYIQFWGGDFYGFRGTHPWNRGRIKTWLCLKRCKAYIHLINGEYERMMEIFSIPKPHFVAPMPGDPRYVVDFKAYWKPKTDDVIRFLVGNSATRENQHKEAYDILTRFQKENIEIYSPLSYGDERYRDEVIQYGKRLFGDRYYPLTEFMNYGDYLELLSKMDVGVFNNNRQQALGNIFALLAMGKRVYIRDDISSWNSLRAAGYQMAAFHTLQSIPCAEVAVITEQEKETNLTRYCAKQAEAVPLWQAVFDSVE